MRKQFAAEVKALSPEAGGKRGEFEAIVAVFDNVDKVGDRVKGSAFDATLADWRKSGRPIPIILAHEWNDPWAHIGFAMPEDVIAVPGKGLHVTKGVLDIDDNPVAAQVHRLMERGTLKEFSFGYRVPEGGERKAADGAYDLVKLDLIEFGPCLQGVNPDTELLAVKAAVEENARHGDEPTVHERLTKAEAQLAALFEGLKSRNVAVLTDEGDLRWIASDVDPRTVLAGPSDADYGKAHEEALAEDETRTKALAHEEALAEDEHRAKAGSPDIATEIRLQALANLEASISMEDTTVDDTRRMLTDAEAAL